MDYKRILLLSVEASKPGDETIRRRVQYRYALAKEQERELQERLADINAMVKTKSPSLFLQIQRGSPQRSGSSPSTSKTRSRTSP